jgi:hypothetical protein
MPYKSAEARRAAYYRDHEKHLLWQAASTFKKRGGWGFQVDGKIIPHREYKP